MDPAARFVEDAVNANSDRRGMVVLASPDYSTGQRIVDAIKPVDLNVGDVERTDVGKFWQWWPAARKSSMSWRVNGSTTWPRCGSSPTILTAQFQQRLPHRRDALT